LSDIKVKDLFCRPADERALLAYAMKDIEFYYSIISKLTPTDFLYSQHEMFMLLLASLVDKEAENFDVNLIVSAAESTGVLDHIGGLKYIQAISHMQVPEENFEVYLTSVIEAATKYKLHKILTENVENLLNNAKEGTSSLDLLGKVESNILDLSASGLSINEPKDLGDGLEELIEERLHNKIVVSGMSTGYPILDKQIDGMIAGTLLIIAARKKMGKSTLLTNIAINAAYRLSTPVLYVDTELRFEEWRDRAIARIAGVDEREFKHGGYTKDTHSRLMKAARIIKQGKLLHEYMPGYSVDKLVALYKKYKHKENIGLIVFDYLKEPDSSSIDRNRKEYQVLGDVTTKLKDLAGRLNIPALTAVQLNRDNDIADSDRIARYGDVICHWATRDKDEMEEGGIDSGTHKLVIKDTRRGGTTTKHGIGYNFFKSKLEIREVVIDKQYFMDFNKVHNENEAEHAEGDEAEVLF
jgi:replicative DNA helicase